MLIETKSALPDGAFHNPDPAYLRSLLERAGISQRAGARALGIDERAMRYYMAGEREIPYTVQYCVEVLARAGQVRDEPPASTWFKPAQRQVTDKDVGLVVVALLTNGGHLLAKVGKDGFGPVLEQLPGDGVDGKKVSWNAIAEYMLVSH